MSFSGCFCGSGTAGPVTNDEDVTTLTLFSVAVLKKTAAGVLGGACVVGAVLKIPEARKVVDDGYAGQETVRNLPGLSNDLNNIQS